MILLQAGIERDTVVQCLRYLSVSHLVRSEWKKVFGDVVTGEEEAASIIILQRVVFNVCESKQQIVREQHPSETSENKAKVCGKLYLTAKRMISTLEPYPVKTYLPNPEFWQLGCLI